MPLIHASFRSLVGVLAFATVSAATPAQAQLVPGFDNSTLLGGTAGAAIGGALGSNLAGSGNRDEGTAIGAIVGGLAGAAVGNARSTYAANPYAGQLNPGFSGQSLFGTLAGAGVGGAIGSNLAGSGVREEGTAIGALIGGIAGYALSDNRGAFGTGGGTGGAYRFDAPAYGAPQPARQAAPQPSPYSPAPYAPAPYAAPGYGVPVATPTFASAPAFPAGGVSTQFGGYIQGQTYSRTVTHQHIVEPVRTYAAPTYSAPTYSAPLPRVNATTHHYYSNSCRTVC